MAAGPDPELSFSRCNPHLVALFLSQAETAWELQLLQTCGKGPSTGHGFPNTEQVHSHPLRKQRYFV